MRGLVRLAVILPALFSLSSLHAQTIAAASDRQPVLDPMIREYNTQSGATVQATYGSSGKLATQIEAGAPFSVFISADSSWMQRVQPRLVNRHAARIAIGRVALVAPIRSPICGAGIRGLSVETGKVAIASPDHAPYGRAAKEVLERAQVWPLLVDEKRIVVADSVANAAQWVSSGVARVGLISWTHARLLPTDRWCVEKIPTAQHRPLHKEIIALDKRGEAFVDWLLLPAQLAQFARAGLSDD